MIWRARYKAHVAGKGARYTRANPPARLLESVLFPDRSSASIAEYRIKHLPRARKIAFLLDLKLVGKYPSQGKEKEGSQAG
jgi:putative endonuclease